MIGKLFVTAAVGVMLTAAPAYAGSKGDGARHHNERSERGRHDDRGSACGGYRSIFLKKACHYRHEARYERHHHHHHHHHGLGHCKGRGEGHEKHRGRGHDKDDSCPVSA